MKDSVKYGCGENDLAHYTCKKITKSIEVNGDLNKPEWQNAIKSPRFVDMASGHPSLFDTRTAALWDNENLYIAFWGEEPFVSATQTKRDSLVFLENCFEILIDGGDTYYEFQINALNTIYEVFFIWKDAYKRGGKFDVPEFDVHKEKAMTFGGDYDRTGNTFWWGRNKRGLRWAFLDYDMPKLQAQVKVDGKVNDSTHIDKGWTAEIAIPWKSMEWLANGRSLPPKEGDIWRMFFGRFQKIPVAGQENPLTLAWSLNKHGLYDTHLPECFSFVHFSE